MAKSNNNKIAMLTNFVLIIALLVIVSMAESRQIGFLKGIIKSSDPSCTQVHGVADGDTCFDVANSFNLSTSFFEAINPNLNCNALFIGEWLCVAGTA